LKNGLIGVVLVGIAVFSGCSRTIADRPKAEKKDLLTVDFKEGQPLRYSFASGREITIDWDPEKKSPGSRGGTIDKSTESMEMVATYTAKKVDPYGGSAVEVRIESAKVSRSKGGNRDDKSDAVEHLASRTFVIEIGPDGKIVDYSQLDALIKEIGQKAFRPETGGGRIKEPDMIGDFVATQWFLWDSISSIADAAKGVTVGQTWSSQLSVPGPMVMRKARDVTYKLSEIRPTAGGPQAGRLAVIKSSYKPAETVPQGWPIPYSGSFQMAGTFGFLSGYKLLDLQGQGEELFNIDLGRIEQSTQKYQVQVQAFIPLGISVSPRITIDQTITMRLTN